ncbi:MAG: nucleoside-diphosphate kinase, partial [Chloroflexi bacterium]
MERERTLIIVKPDAVQRGLTGEIIKRFEQRGLRIIGMKFMQVSRELAEKHYDVHRERPFFNAL